MRRVGTTLVTSALLATPHIDVGAGPVFERFYG